MLRYLLAALLALMAVTARADSPNDSPQALLRALYEVHDEGNGPLMRSEGRAQRRVFFTESLALALEGEINRPDPEELGNLDFDPFYNAQETELGAMDIAVAKVSGNATVALVRFDNGGDSIEIAYRVVLDGEAWRIDDIEYGEGRTLRKTLRGE
jgi:hypothetical protein